MIVDRLFDRALSWVASHRLSIPDSISKLRSNQRSLDLYSNPSLLCHAVMVHSFIFFVDVVRMWALDLYMYHICRINFEYIFREYSPNLLHFQQQFYFASLFTFCLLLILFVWYWISFVSVPFFAAFHPGNLAVELRVCRSPNPHLFALSICSPITRRTFSLSLSSNSV